MKKAIPIIVAIVVLVGVLGWYLMANRAVAPVQPVQNTPTPKESASEIPSAVPDEKQSVLGSIKDAMGLGKRLTCTSTDATSGTVTTMLVEGKKMKVTTTVSGATVYAFFDGSTQYAWSSNAKTGVKTDASCIEEMKEFAKKLPTNSQSTPKQDLESYEDLQNVSCVPAEGADFTLPTDVTFTDQCAMLRESMKAIEQMKDQVPAGMPMQL